MALPLAAAVALATAVSPPVAWLLVLPITVVLAIQLYRRRWPGGLRPAQGAKLGAISGLFSFFFFGILVAIEVATDPGKYRQQMADLIHQAIARNPAPEVRQAAESMFGGTGGIILFVGLMMAFILVFLLAIGALSGVLTAVFSKGKNS